MTVYQYAIGGEMTPAAAVDDIRTPDALVREIKKYHRLNTRTCKGQTAIDRNAAVIIVSARVSFERDERKRR